ncbi:hypothetical protein ABC418_08965 [Lactiplantibacillus plantarum]|uniref:phage tail assembly chaperone G n=1 Tax=Lactiplantibacillus plantarum TaxID=1590 RepID=UPI003965D477
MARSLKITLLINGKSKTYTEKFFPAKRILEALDLVEFTGKREVREIVTERVKFLAEIFTNPEVTEDAIWNGFNGINFQEDVAKIICDVAGIDSKNVMTEPMKE